MFGWFGEVWDQIKAVDVQYLVIGCALQSVQTVLNGLAWRNILGESYGTDHVPARPLVSAYAGGIGLNSFLPAQAGTFAYFGMFRAIITGSTFAGILAAGVVQNLFFGVVGALNYVYLFLSRGGSAGKAEDQATADSTVKLVLIGLAVLLVLLVVRLLWKRLRSFWEDAKAGAVILRRPGRYVRRCWSCRSAPTPRGSGSTPTSCTRSGSPSRSETSSSSSPPTPSRRRSP